jgi:hypothetical protein
MNARESFASMDDRGAPEPTAYEEARAKLFGFVESGAEEADLPTFAAAIDALCAEVLNEAAAVAGEFTGRFEDMDAMKAAGLIGPFTMGAAIRDELHRMAAASTPPVPDNTTGDEGTAASTTVACTCLGGPTTRDGQVLHSGYCDTVVHAPWTPQREAAIRATAKEGAGSLHSALGATVPNEDVLGLFLQLDEARKELARRTPTGDEGHVEYGVQSPGRERVLAVTLSRAEAVDTLAGVRVAHPTAVLVQRTVRYGAWTEVTS